MTIDIRDHGGSFGGSAKRKFYKRLDGIISIPATKRGQIITAGYAERFFLQPLKFNKRYYGVMTNEYQNVVLRIMDDNFNVQQSGGSVNYASSWSYYYGIGISSKYSKLFRLELSGSSNTVYMYNLDANGNMDAGISKYMGTGSFASNSLIVDDANDKFYFVYGTTLYCFQISTFSSSATPIWSAPLPFQPFNLRLFGDLLVATNSNTNYGTRTYTLTSNGITLIGTQTTMYFDAGNVVYDGTYLYLSFGGIIKKYTKDLTTLVATSADLSVATAGIRPLTGGVPTSALFFASQSLIDGKIHICTDNSILLVDPVSLNIVSEYLLFDSGATPSKTPNKLTHQDSTPIYYDVDDGEAVYSVVSQNIYNSSGTSESTVHLQKSILKY
jgi:hypothetical protein